VATARIDDRVTVAAAPGKPITPPAVEPPSMDVPVSTLATILAAILGVAAFLTLFMQRPVVAGTLFVLTAFAIYIRETNT
jgi:hypothetical protein